ncbi:MAG: hypothetical protein RBS68_09515 [Anaerolineales bacterium]|jgi:hypothetical protein|nr:hypothetical protein [Anaerolineales bacterium]
MKRNLNRIAAALAFLIGAMSIVAGGKALQGWDPGYNVLGWLPVYNFAMGILTVLIPSILIWRAGRFALPAAIATFGIHALTLLVLVAAFRGVVAAESISAMVFRIAVWAVILGLMFFARRRNTSKDILA